MTTIQCRCGKCGKSFVAKPAGGHRIVCGDATNAEDVEAALDGDKPNLAVTDPPYGVGYDADWRNRTVMVRGERPGQHGSRAIGAVLNDDRADWRAAWALFPGNVAYVWHAGTQAHNVALSLKAAGFAIRAQIVWVKQRFVIGRGDYHHQHEPAFYALREGATEGDEDWHFVPEHEIASYAVRQGEPGAYVGGRKQSTVWFIEHTRSETGHSTQKPVEAMRRPIVNNSLPGALVYDPFLGSGTTVIAAAMSGRWCRGLELNPSYVDVIINRWCNFTGGVAVLAASGQTFEDVARGRTDNGERSQGVSEESG